MASSCSRELTPSSTQNQSSVMRNKEREGTKQSVFECPMTEHRLAGSPGGWVRTGQSILITINYICAVMYGPDVLPILLSQPLEGHILPTVVAAEFIPAGGATGAGIMWVIVGALSLSFRIGEAEAQGASRIRVDIWVLAGSIPEWEAFFLSVILEPPCAGSLGCFLPVGGDSSFPAGQGQGGSRSLPPGPKALRGPRGRSKRGRNSHSSCLGQVGSPRPDVGFCPSGSPQPAQDGVDLGTRSSWRWQYALLQECADSVPEKAWKETHLASEQENK